MARRPSIRRLKGLLLLGLVTAFGACGSSNSPAMPTTPTTTSAPATPEGDPAAYKFAATDGAGGPVRFNPCRPIHYVVNLQNAPGGVMAKVHDAFAATGAAAQIEFVFDGTTDEAPAVVRGERDGRRPVQPARYGADHWAPILVMWLPRGRPEAFSGGDTVHGEAYNHVAEGQRVSGTIVLNSDARQSARWAKLSTMHELAHVLGLDHVEDRNSVMATEGVFASKRDDPRWSSGDLEGLRQLGRGAGCLSPADPRLLRP